MKIIIPYLHIAYTKLPSVKKCLTSTLNISLLELDSDEPVLSPKEYQLLSKLLEGKSNNSISKELKISKFTVKTHVQRIIKKLNATNRQHAVAIALELKLIVF